MFISPSSLTLSSTLSASGTNPGNIRSVRACSFPDRQPLSTPLLPQADQSVNPPSSYAPFLPRRRSGLFTGSASTMSRSRVVSHPSISTRFDIFDPLSPSIPSVSITLDSPGPDTTANTGTSIPVSSTFSSNSDASRSLAFPSTVTGTTPSSAFWSSLFIPNSTYSHSMSGLSFTSTPTSTSSFSAAPTSTVFSSLATGSSLPLSPSTGSPLPSSPVPTLSTASSTFLNTRGQSTLGPTTLILSTTMVQIFSSFSPHSSPPTSTYTLTSVVPGNIGTTTVFVITSNVLSTEPPGSVVTSNVSHSPATIAGIVLGIVGAFAFSALWLFCARRRHRTLAREAALIPPENHAPRPLNDEILDLEDNNVGSVRSDGNYSSQTGPIMDERYAGLLTVLQSTERLENGHEAASTTGVYGSRRDTLTNTNGDDELFPASSPTLPLHVLPPDDPPYLVSLSPPPSMSQPPYHQIAQPPPPPSAYYMATRRRSSPGPEAATWLGGYSIAPSCNSHYARSQTLGSGSGSGSVDALSRTRTGSEDALLGISKMTEVSAGASTPGGIGLTTAIEPGGHQLGLGSAFGSPVASVYCPSSVYPSLQYDTTGSQDARTVSGSAYARSGTPSSFDVLRSVSSQGALSSVYDPGHRQSQGFKFGFNKAGSLSSGSTGKKTGSNRHSFGVPPTSFKAWKDWSSSSSDKEKVEDGRSRPRSGTSASLSGSVDEKQGRSSPVIGVRTLFGRLRRAGHAASPHSSSKDLSSLTQTPVVVDPEKVAADRITPPPVTIEAATPQRRRFSFILSNPDQHPSSGVRDAMPSSATPPHEERDPNRFEMANPVPGGLPTMPFPTGFMFAAVPSPAPTEELCLTDGLLHPRLQTHGYSDASLRDFEDYSRPIGGIVKNRLCSTTTFGTQDEGSSIPGQGTPALDVVSPEEHEDENGEVDISGASSSAGVPRDSWSVEGPSRPTTTYRPSLHDANS